MTHRALILLPVLALSLAACGAPGAATVPAPATQASSEFPNELSGNLISPEGQRIIDRVLQNQGAQRMQGDFDPRTEKLDLEGAEPITAQAVSVTTMKAVHNSSMSQFLSYRSSRYGAPSLDWSTDYCSNVPDTGVSFNFINPCTRHDFGYRNYKRYGIFTSTNRKFIDDKFLADMKDHCSTRSIFLKPSCYETAYTYYAGVRALGGCTREHLRGASRGAPHPA